MSLHRYFVVLVAVIFLQACSMTLGNERMMIKQDSFVSNYPKIKEIVVEEAANNGFGTLTSEVKPSQYNNWKGKLFFQLKTAAGTDQLWVEFSQRDGDIDVWVHGAGMRANADSASKAISARLSQL